jgi:hypothetical protein
MTFVVNGPSPEQRAELSASHDRTRESLNALVETYVCDRLNGVDQVVATALLFEKLADNGSVGSLALLASVAVDALAERAWGERR